MAIEEDKEEFCYIKLYHVADEHATFYRSNDHSNRKRKARISQIYHFHCDDIQIMDRVQMPNVKQSLLNYWTRL